MMTKKNSRFSRDFIYSIVVRVAGRFAIIVDLKMPVEESAVNSVSDNEDDNSGYKYDGEHGLHFI